MEIKIELHHKDILPIAVREEDGAFSIIIAKSGPSGENKIEIAAVKDQETLILIAQSFSQASARLLSIALQDDPRGEE